MISSTISYFDFDRYNSVEKKLNIIELNEYFKKKILLLLPVRCLFYSAANLTFGVFGMFVLCLIFNAYSFRPHQTEAP
jgi:hypothetical protein